MTDLQLLIQDRLKTNLDLFLRQCIKQGYSYRQIADLIKTQTDVLVSKSAIFNWVADVTPKK